MAGRAAAAHRAGGEAMSSRPVAHGGADGVGTETAGPLSALRVAGGRILETGAVPQAGDRIVDLRGDRLLPGLINAHDHLHLNVYPRLRYRSRYVNASEWIRDIDARR